MTEKEEYLVRDHFLIDITTEEFQGMRAAEDRALDEWQEGHDFQWREN